MVSRTWRRRRTSGSEACGISQPARHTCPVIPTIAKLQSRDRFQMTFDTEPQLRPSIDWCRCLRRQTLTRGARPHRQNARVRRPGRAAPRRDLHDRRKDCDDRPRGNGEIGPGRPREITASYKDAVVNELVLVATGEWGA